MDDIGCVKKVRELLKFWDEGLITVGEFESRMNDMFATPFFEIVERGEKYIRFGSCCCSSHAPDRAFKVQITIQPHGFTAERCE